MKRRIAFLTVLAITVLGPLMSPASAAVKAGATCSKQNATSISSGFIYTCIKSGKKLIWSKGVKAKINTPTPKPSPSSTKVNPFEAEIQKALDQKKKEEAAVQDGILSERAKFAELAKIKCGTGVACEVGNTGPGGGVVFFIAAGKQSWGQYLEMAPDGWYRAPAKKVEGVRSLGYGDPASVWCDKETFRLVGAITNPELVKTVGKEIGKGQANTNLMLAGCKFGAAQLATSYKGGGLQDWFLPSINELNEMCKFASGIKTGQELPYLGGSVSSPATCGTREMPSTYTALGFFFRGDNGRYWSSTEDSENRAWCQRFDDIWTSNWEKFNSYYVRPIRAF